LLTFRAHSSVDEIPQRDWDALALATPPESATPFVRWAFLDALEATGCAAPGAGWIPRHLAVYRGDRLVAAAPAYLKHDSHADFSRDFGFADFALRNGVRYYPKLAITSPITPVTGRRILTAADEQRAPLVRAILDGARAIAEEARAVTVQVLFPDPAEAAELERQGLALRLGMQAHWFNRGYRDVDDWMASLSSKTRYQVRKERAALGGQGIAIRTVRGEELVAERRKWGRVVAGLYQSTVEKIMWGGGWLTPAFFERLFDRMPEPLEVVAAVRGDRVIAGAFNASGPARLWGRYWGCVEDHPFLHFNVCLYHSVEDCIRRGIQVFEGGAGGEHKLHRGFDTAPTWTAHTFLHPRLDRSIREYLAEERVARQSELDRRAARRKDPRKP
jgi:predicted N-acyltransferase